MTFSQLTQRLNQLSQRARTLTPENAHAFSKEIVEVQQAASSFLSRNNDKEKLISLSASLDQLVTTLEHNKNITAEELRALNKQQIAHGSYGKENK